MPSPALSLLWNREQPRAECPSPHSWLLSPLSTHGPPPPHPPQERATKVSHGNTARMAVEYGDDILGKVCGAIASDESRHEIAYTRIVDEFFR